MITVAEHGGLPRCCSAVLRRAGDFVPGGRTRDGVPDGGAGQPYPGAGPATSRLFSIVTSAVVRVRRRRPGGEFPPAVLVAQQIVDEQQRFLPTWRIFFSVRYGWVSRGVSNE
ncbi:hypothetical protein Ari01nite_90370 [Paractinoplanes rishiriensis]|uniref:Uncharacterized protein n=1 Tax=Paractinoplanes rishiriensis TaxID=1050105 RepID=A0A919N2R9_9ACTN|nr:hypothetical protein Ari01nite_90370 [Actinoplanes rishiriensis]